MNRFKRILAKLIGFYIWIFIMIVPHELGHLVTAKLYHLPVEEFSLGFGPRLASVHLFDIDWSLRSIPLGGFVSVDLNAPQIPYSHKMVILIAGCLVNILMGIYLIRKYHWQKIGKDMIELGIWNITPIFAFTDGAQAIKATLLHFGATREFTGGFIIVSGIISLFIWLFKDTFKRN